MLLDDFETYFASQGLLTDFAVFKDAAQDKPDKAIIISEYSGAAVSAKIAGASRSVQVLARGPNPVDGMAMANVLFRSLRVEDDIIQLTPERWGQITLRQSPIRIKVDTQGRVYYGFNLGIITYND